MRPFALLIPVLLVAFSACTDSEAAREPTFGGELTATSFTVDPAKDTVLKTPGGALIAVPAGSLDAGDAPSVTLQVKEALTAGDMSRGGAQTSSDLTSSGMIYVNVTGSQAVSIHKPLSISIPAKESSSDMMVYKGEAGEEGIRWTDGKALSSSPGAQNLEAGKTLFQTNCASCHGFKGEISGPPLGWITQRRDRQWLYAFTRSNAKLLWRGDGYSCYLFNRYKTPMPQYPNLSDADLDQLYHYIDKASHALDSGAVVNLKASFDSCVANDPNCGNLASRTRSLPEATAADSSTAITAAVTDYYSFTIDKHGWYSVAHKNGGTAAAAPAIELPTEENAHPVEPLAACPCWCNESAYRRADSLSRKAK